MGAKPVKNDTCKVDCFYVDPATGSDTNDGLTTGNSFASVAKCIEAANAMAGHLLESQHR